MVVVVLVVVWTKEQYTVYNATSAAEIAAMASTRLIVMEVMFLKQH